MKQPLRWSEDVERIPAGEAAEIEQVVDAVRAIQQRDQQQNAEFRRDVHVKSHGCVRATLEVLPQLPAELAQGLFATGARWPAVMRFSNSNPNVMPDLFPDGRGLAIQVQYDRVADPAMPESMSRTQDFVMVNYPVFIARDVRDYLRIQQDRLTAQAHPIAATTDVLTRHSVNPLKWRWRELVATTRIASKLPRNPLTYLYYSMAPIRYGDFVVKYRVAPSMETSISRRPLLTPWKPDGMRQSLQETLRDQEVLLDFQVQLCVDLHTTPVEDPTIEWSQQDSPYRTVAKIRIAPQDPAEGVTPDRGDSLAFSVWNCLPEHRPLGGINRVRQAVYQSSQAWRRKEVR